MKAVPVTVAMKDVTIAYCVEVNGVDGRAEVNFVPSGKANYEACVFLSVGDKQYSRTFSFARLRQPSPKVAKDLLAETLATFLGGG